ncbi:hypothetical protein L1987_84868 [Smallanthus sonchifolius]|uniref:Uncharacterized protein n=1 Tax=Smallanthus sonchifolius TaxID=185202 RepID=A0ACB8XW48_9ASTR|nr:hypothetical protein L1987_84868 [Smallanthus sonchifolius]
MFSFILNCNPLYSETVAMDLHSRSYRKNHQQLKIINWREEDLKFWPHSFEFRLRVSLGMYGNLSLVSQMRNVNGKLFSFSFAYHSYLSVLDIK